MLVLRGCGPKGYPGMPEVANLPLPTKLLEQGVRDMVRICDGRMSGTAYGTVVLHVAPEAAAGGPLALVRSGDFIVLDVAARRLDVDLPADELAARTPSAATVDAFARPTRGWERLYVDHVQQANTGADLDFLVGASGDQVSRESHWPPAGGAGGRGAAAAPPPHLSKVFSHRGRLISRPGPGRVVWPRAGGQPPPRRTPPNQVASSSPGPDPPGRGSRRS